MAYIEASDIYLQKDGVEILKNISIQLEKSLCHVFMGTSGSGKSTLVKILAGLTPADSGTVQIDDFEIHKGNRDHEFRKISGFVFQDAALWANMPVYNNLLLPLEYHFSKRTKEEHNKLIHKWIEKIGFNDMLTTRPANISAGEQKLISFVRGIIHEPELIFMDEPTSFVDAGGVEKMIAIIKELKLNKRTLLIVTHNPIIASRLADTITILDKGKIIASDKVAAITKNTDPVVNSLLKGVLDRAETWDDDILGLLE